MSDKCMSSGVVFRTGVQGQLFRVCCIIMVYVSFVSNELFESTSIYIESKMLSRGKHFIFTLGLVDIYEVV